MAHIPCISLLTRARQGLSETVEREIYTLEEDVRREKETVKNCPDAIRRDKGMIGSEMPMHK